MACIIGQDLFKDLVAGIPFPPTLDDLKFIIPPITLDIFDLLNQGIALQNPLKDAFDCLLPDLAVLAADTAAAGFLTTADKDLLTGALTTSSSTVNNFQSHTDNFVNPDVMPRILGPTSSALRNRASLPGLPALNASNPCDLLNQIMGSILGAGALLLDALIEALKPVYELLEAAIAPIAGAVATIVSAILAAVNAIAELIAREVAALAQILNEAINTALAGLLGALAGDPCFQPLLHAVGTPQLRSSLQTNVPNFPQF